MKMAKAIILGWTVGSLDLVLTIMLRYLEGMPLLTRPLIQVQLTASLLTMAVVAVLVYRVLTMYEERIRENGELHHRIRNQLQIVKYSAHLLRKHPNPSPELWAGIEAACEHIRRSLDALARIQHLQKE